MLSSAKSAPLPVQRGIVPGFLRHDEGTPEQIEAAIKSGDPADVKAIDDFKQAKPDQKEKLMEILLGQVWLAPFDRRAVARILNSYGDPVEMTEGNLSQLKRAADRGFDPTDIKGNFSLVVDFKAELKRKALDNLGDNITLIQKEATRLGVAGGGKRTPDTDKAIEEQQELAQEISDAKRLMAAARNIVVGMDLTSKDAPQSSGFNFDGKPIKFDPEREPVPPMAWPVTEPNPGARQMPWHTIYAQYSGLAKTVADVLNQNPALYALTILMQEGSSKPAKSGEDPHLVFPEQRIEGFEVLSADAAREKVGKALTEVYNNARFTMVDVMSGKLDPLMFDSLVARFLAGDWGPQWTKPYTKFACRHAVADAESSFDRTMANIGLALLLASIAIGTMGAAAPVLGAVLAAANVGTAAAGAALSTLKAQDLERASQSTVTDAGGIVSVQQAGKAQLDAQLYQFGLIAAVAGEAIGVLLKPPLTGAASQLDQLNVLAAPDKVSVVTGSLKEMDVGQVALRSGKTPEELLEIVVPRAASDPEAEAAANKIRDFLNQLSGPKIGPTAGDNSLASLLRRAKMTFREYWTRVYGLGYSQADQVTLHAGLGDAELTYIKLIEDSPGREAGIYRNARTGEHAVVQGTGNWTGGGVAHIDSLPEAANDHWILVEHFHPERNFAVQFPSGATGDFNVLLYDHGEVTAAGRQAVLNGAPSSTITQPVSARIRFRDPVSGAYHYTTYGYDPNRGAIGRFFVEVQTETGARVEYSFHNMTEYQNTIANIRPGEPIVRP